MPIIFLFDNAYRSACTVSSAGSVLLQGDNRYVCYAYSGISTIIIAGRRGVHYLGMSYALTGISYDDMEISNGQQASIRYLNITFLKGEKDLLDYCGFDTEGMIYILRELYKIVII